MASMSSCIGCHKEFIPKRKGQEYHDRACFLESTVKLKTCPECGNKFKRQYTGQVCCSPECANVYRAKKNTKGGFLPCSECGNPVYKMPSKQKKDRFCNNKCYYAWLRSSKNPYKNRKHTTKEKGKIRQANLDRDYNAILTDESREKMADSARNKEWTDESKEKLRQKNLGKTLTEEIKQKIKAHGKYGEDNMMWKGDMLSYAGLHIWVALHKGRPAFCVDCGITASQGRLLQWSNQSGLYFRDLDDFVGRCLPCHRKHDTKLGHPKKYSFDDKGHRIGLTIIVPQEYL